MALIIPNYITESDVLLPEAYMSISNINIDILNETFQFTIAIFSSKNAMLQHKKPVENDITGLANLPKNININNSDLLQYIDTLILQKINNVAERTQEECDIYNNSLDINLSPATYWEQVWDTSYKKYANAYLETQESDMGNGEILNG